MSLECNVAFRVNMDFQQYKKHNYVKKRIFINLSFLILFIVFCPIVSAEIPAAPVDETKLLDILDQADKIRVVNFKDAIKFLEPQKALFIESGIQAALAEYYLYLALYNIVIDEFFAAENHLDKAREIIDKYDIPEQEASELFYRGMIAQKQAKFDKAVQLFLIQHDFAKKHNVISSQVYSKIHLSHLYISQGNNLEALIHIKEAYQLLPKIKPLKWKAKFATKALVAASMGQIYLNLGEFNKAIKFYKESVAGFKEFNSLIDAGTIQARLATIYAEKLEDYGKAKIAFEQIYKIAIEIKNERLIATYHLGIGKIHLKTIKYLQAINSFNQALTIAKSNKWQSLINKSLFNKAQALIGINDLDSAHILLEETIPHFEKFKLYNQSYKVHDNLQQIYFQKNNIEKAYLHLSKALAFYKINQNEESNEALAKIRTEMDIELKEAANLLLVKENELSQLKLQDQKLLLKTKDKLIISYTSVIFLLVIIAFILLLFARRLYKLAFTDPMTKLANRRRVFKFGLKEFTKAKKRKEKLSIITFDLDKFKNINDSFGHEIGDKVLITVSNICSHIIGEKGLFGRIGGEEFLLILPGAKLSHALKLAENMRQNIQDYDWNSLHTNLSVTSSFGVSCLTINESSMDELVKASDDALYLSKKDGRNRVNAAT